MKRRMRTAKRWLGFLLSVMLVVEASGMQVLAEEPANRKVQTAMETATVSEGDATEGDVSTGVVSAGDVSGTDISMGDITAPDVTIADVDVTVVDVTVGDMVAAAVADADIIASGTYKGMDWTIDENGHLSIFGTYTGVVGSNDVKWNKNNAEDVITAKVTATGVTDMTKFLSNMPNMQRVDFSEFDTSTVTDICALFIACPSLKEADLSRFTARSYDNLGGIFNGCYSLKKVTFGEFDTSKTTDMGLMFKQCEALESLDLSSFDTSQVKDMSYMFSGCSSLSQLDISKFNTSHVKDMSYMFSGCTSIKTLDLSHFDTSNVTTMEWMFRRCSVESLNLSGFDMSRVTNADDMLFWNSVNEIWTPKNLTLDVELPSKMLYENSVEYSSLPKNMTESLYLAETKKSGEYYGLQWYLTYSGRLGITGTYGSGTGTDTWAQYKNDIVAVMAKPSGMTSMQGWFQDYTNLKTVDFTGMDSGEVTDMSKLFYGCTSLESVNWGNINTAKTINMSQMFTNCQSLETLDFSGLSAAALTSADNMLAGCSSLEELYCFKNFPNKVTLTLPTTMVNASGKQYTSMPAGQSSSVYLRKTWPKGTYCGMSWNIDANGQLTISGTYTATENVEVPWLAYTDWITSAKVTAGGVVSTKKWFYGMDNLKDVDLSAFDMSKVKDATYMFKESRWIRTIKTPKKLALDVVLPTMMMDDDYVEYTSLPKNLTSSVTITAYKTIANGTYYRMDWMLKENGYLKISGKYVGYDNNLCWTEEVADKIVCVKIDATDVLITEKWFYNCTNLKRVDLSEFDLSNMKYADKMFEGCSSLTELDMGNQNLAPIVEMDRMFAGCSALTSIDISGFDLAKVKNFNEVFEGCTSLVEIKTPINLAYDVTFPTALNDPETGLWRDTLPKNNATSMHLKKAEIVKSGTNCGMNWTINEYGGLEIFGTFSKTADTDTDWRNHKDLVQGVKVTATDVTNLFHWFNGMSNLKVADFSEFDTSKVITMCETFYNCSALTEVDLTNVNTSKVTDMNRMFFGCSSLKELDVSGFDTSNVTNMAAMFCSCSELTKLDVSKFNTAKVTDMNNMFFRCKKVEELDVSNFDTSKVTDMQKMFYECIALETLDLSNFDTGLVTNMYAMFYNDAALTELDVSSFNTANVTNMNRMFWYCRGLAELDVSRFNTAKVTDMTGMFNTCSGLTELDLSNFDMSEVTGTENMLNRLTSLKQIKTPLNLKLDVDLPAAYGSGTGVVHRKLPKYMSESVLYQKVIAEGKYIGMDWFLEAGGFLYIYGTYGQSANTDVSWRDYSNQITGVKVTATGVTNTNQWFSRLYNLKTADLSEFDSSKVTTMNSMFYNCGKLPELDLGNCDFGAVTDAQNMLEGCETLSYIVTPKNLEIDVELPIALEDKERNVYTELPKQLDKSIVLTYVIYRIAPIEDQVYTGKAVKPAVVVYKGNRVLKEGVDYTVSYKNNVKAAAGDATKAPTVTVKGKTNYMGNLTASFTIQPKEITQKNVRTTPTIVYQNGKVQKFKSAVSVAGRKLKANTDYKIVLTDTSEGAYKNPGKYSVDIQGTGNYTGTVQGTLIVLNNEQVQASKLKIGKISACTYVANEPAMPTPTVSYKGKELVKDVDYKIVYSGNDKAGKATLTIVGLENVAKDGIYVIGEVTKTFTIKGTAINKAKFDYPKTATYTGNEICPWVSLTIGETQLRHGWDYSVSYTKNVNVGTATMIITGEGGYTGTMKKTFKIVPDETVVDQIDVVIADGLPVYYSTSGSKPEIAVMLNGEKLEQRVDYTVSYKNNKKIATADVIGKKTPAVVIKGKGNYKFTKTVHFPIAACPVNKLNVTAADKFLGDKKGYLSAPVVKDGDKKLKADKDYEIVGYKTLDGAEFTGKEEVVNGTYVIVTVRGIGNYTGEISVMYRIATQSISKMKITASSLAYNEGNPVVYSRQDIRDEMLVVKDNKTKEILQYGRDYRIVGYTNNEKIGTATVTIEGCGVYGGTKTVKFKIVKYKLR